MHLWYSYITFSYFVFLPVLSTVLEWKAMNILFRETMDLKKMHMKWQQPLS